MSNLCLEFYLTISEDSLIESMQGQMLYLAISGDSLVGMEVTYFIYN